MKGTVKIGGVTYTRAQIEAALEELNAPESTLKVGQIVNFSAQFEGQRNIWYILDKEDIRQTLKGADERGHNLGFWLSEGRIGTCGHPGDPLYGGKLLNAFVVKSHVNGIEGE